MPWPDSALRAVPVAVVALALAAACADHAALAGLEDAVRSGDADRVRRQLTGPVSANASLPDGWAPLPLAASLGHADVVSVLLEAGADLEQARRLGLERQWTALGWAASGGHLDVVRVLLARGGRVDARNSRHQTPLMAAALGGHDEVMAVLVDAGADTGARDAAGRTAAEMVP